MGCTHYPECDYTRDLEGTHRPEREAPQTVEGRVCPQCNSALQIRQGRYGKFIGCSAYPDCTYIEPLEKPADTGVALSPVPEGYFAQAQVPSWQDFLLLLNLPQL